MIFFFFKQKTAYEIGPRDWSSDVCSSDLPLPKSIHTETIINAIDPAKDVDGLHPNNAARLAGGFAALAPCPLLGCTILTKIVHACLEAMNAMVIGRSYLVGRPLVQLLLNENATVTIAHSRS